MSLSNAVALVTGGSGGLGARICSALAAEGVDIAVGFFHGAARAQEVRDGIEALGRRSIAVSLDQTSPEAIDTAIAQVAGQLGGLDILVNNAGMATGGHAIPLGDLEAFTPEIWDQMMAVNLRGPSLRLSEDLIMEQPCRRRNARFSLRSAYAKSQFGSLD